MAKKEEITQVQEVQKEQIKEEPIGIPKGFFKYGSCEICNLDLVLPLCSGDDRYSRLVWGIYMLKTKEVPKLCHICRKVYREVIKKADTKRKGAIRAIVNDDTDGIIKVKPRKVLVSDYLKSVALGLTEGGDTLRI